jgi:phosphoribosylglycinamide formyltransferase-1
MDPVRMAIFASGGGSNARVLEAWFSGPAAASGVPALYVTNNPHSGVVAQGTAAGVPVVVTGRGRHSDGAWLVSLLESHGIGLIVLAGYLKRVPEAVVARYPGRILNLHPALLPKFGGKGMYGMNVHKAVISSGEKQSGITIHYVNERYDEGEILFQAAADIPEGTSPEQLQRMVQALEHEHFPRIVEKVCKKLRSEGNNA